MLLSSVNFVAKPKSGKGNKDKDKDKKQDIVKKVAEEKITECEKCKKEREEENTIFKFPTPSHSSSSGSFKSSGYFSDAGSDVTPSSPGDRVTIATWDDLCLSVDQFYYTIGLRDESKSDSTCVFRKRTLETKENENGGHVETVVFVLDCDQEFYLTANKNKELELNFYGSAAAPTCDDERAFLVHHTSLGHSLLQPVRHKNSYLHHIDQALSVQQLDLNWRCPEEYFFHFNAVPEPFVYRKSTKPKVCSHSNIESSAESTTDSPAELCSTQNSSTKSDNLIEIPDSLKIQLPTRKVCKKEKFFKNLFSGCFSGRSQLISQADS